MAKKPKDETAMEEAKPQSVVAAEAYAADAGAGFENQTQDDVAIPFLGILQSLSPQVAEKTVKGAEPGLLINTVTNELFEEVIFVPAITQHLFVEWVPRDSGGGFVGIHEVNSPVVSKAKEQAKLNNKGFNELVTPEGNELSETFYLFGIIVKDDEFEPVVMAFTSAKIKVYKKWNTPISTFMLKTISGGKPTKVKPPMYSHQVKVSTFLDTSSKKGNHHNFVLEPLNGEIRNSLLAPDSAEYQAAKAVYESFQLGTAKVNYETPEEASNDDDDDGLF